MAMILRTVLLADDSEDDQRLFVHVLRQAGVDNPIEVVSDGDEALAYLKGQGAFADRRKFPMPCALFLDLKMRRVDGWEVLKWIRMRDELKDMLVVVVTVFNDLRSRIEGYRLGAHTFLVKPFSEREVKNLVQYFRRALTVPTGKMLETVMRSPTFRL